MGAFTAAIVHQVRTGERIRGEAAGGVARRRELHRVCPAPTLRRRCIAILVIGICAPPANAACLNTHHSARQTADAFASVNAGVVLAILLRVRGATDSAADRAELRLTRLGAKARAYRFVGVATVGISRSLPRRSRQVDLRGALCFVNPDGLHWLGRQSARGILIDGTRAVAKLARRPAPSNDEAIAELYRTLEAWLPATSSVLARRRTGG